MTTPATYHTKRSASQGSGASSTSSNSSLNPTARPFTPSKQTTTISIPSTPKAKPKQSLPTINEGDIECFLCDDRLWCPFCSEDKEDGDVKAGAFETPVKGEQNEAFYRTPGHEREGGR